MAERVALTAAVPVMSTTDDLQHFAKSMLPACRLIIGHLCQDRGCKSERPGRASRLFGRPSYSLKLGG